MKKKVFAFVMAAVMVFTMAACGNNDTPANTDADGADSVIRIGGIGPLTGSYANYGISVKNGAEVAVEEINANGGINGMQIEL